MRKEQKQAADPKAMSKKAKGEWTSFGLGAVVVVVLGGAAYSLYRLVRIFA